MIRNTQRTAARIWLFVSAAGFLACVAVPVLDIDIFAGGGALFMVGLLIGFTGLIAAWMFSGRAATLDKMLIGAEVLAQWEFDRETWRSFAKFDLTETIAELTGLRYLVMAISAVVCGVLFLAVTEARWVFPAVFVFINALIWLVCVIRFRGIAAKARQEGPVTVIVSNHAAAVGNEFHIWKGPMLRLDGVALKGRKPMILTITYSTWVRYGRAYYTLRIPVPPGEEEHAAEVAEQLS